MCRCDCLPALTEASGVVPTVLFHAISPARLAVARYDGLRRIGQATIHLSRTRALALRDRKPGTPVLVVRAAEAQRFGVGFAPNGPDLFESTRVPVAFLDFPPLHRLLRIAARDAVNPSDRDVLVRPDSVAYAVLGRTIRRGGMDAPWVDRVSDLKSDRIYLRTRTGIFEAHAPSLVALTLSLSATTFRRVNQGTLLNLNALEAVDFAGRRKRAAVVLPWQRCPAATDWLVVSRKSARMLRRLLSMPRTPRLPRPAQ
jgi:hypothetical protein